MSAKASQTATDEPGENQTGIEAAYEAVGKALKEMDLTEHCDQWIDLQQQYFDLKAAMLARDEAFQQIDLGGTDLYVPSSHPIVGDNPTAQDKHGEVELPTRDDHFSVLDGLRVADPENPHITHAVHIDHVIETDGSVRVEINADPLDELP